ncbi:hypothetical protein ABES02_28525 [Neobacillus pocheonensis]|uniref:hypothetical protein n=1 Tax=Neobacillus pocheonensis TaxID=363869 RepID=UPI003D288BF4
MKKLVDANIGLRILLGDKDIAAITNPVQTAAMVTKVEETRKLVRQVEDGKLVLIFEDEVVEEMIFVMQKIYKVPRQDISELILDLIEADGVEASKLIKDALRIYAVKNLDIVDIKLYLRIKSLEYPYLLGTVISGNLMTANITRLAI